MEKRNEIKRFFGLRPQNDRIKQEVKMKNKTEIIEKTLKRVQGDSRCNVAFTLAEVLITIGIIGVVAALTVPTLMQNITSKQFEAGDKVFTNKINEALKVMNTQQVLTGHSTTESFMNEFKKHYKINNICIDDPMQCFSETVTVSNNEVDLSNVREAKNIVQYAEEEQDWGTKVVGVQFANGTSTLMAYNPKCKANPFDMQSDVMHCVAMVYDLNANATPNEFGKDLKSTANVKNLANVECIANIGDLCITKLAFKPTPITKAECIENKNKLDIKECPPDTDYWAGAVKQCGGVSKLASLEQLAQIANYVYNTNGIGVDDAVSNLSLDSDKASELGISSEISFWSSYEPGGNYSYYRAFSKNSTSRQIRHSIRYSPSLQAFCVK